MKRLWRDRIPFGTITAIRRNCGELLSGRPRIPAASIVEAVSLGRIAVESAKA